jgi:two-component system chemotaxis sensor kinase CheA
VREGERSYGLVVERILDIVEQELKVQRRAPRVGLQGTAVIGGKVTDLLDIAAVVRRFEHECQAQAQAH